ncbi:uncharacterized protein LOC62_03G004168 [Vanrija pseudolonga]|uniref:Uncharacterized protein n=1 Tax=Vanrija pseudolonga TaxID=143232 RepID=A0AAF0Y9J2_9TREE|nr:hypothetical protein LOC62_03G004168 [Vanrija pseudolonga]
MGLQRTPPQNATRTRRDDTFSPSQAFAPASRLARSPAGAAAPATDDDEMEVEAGLGAVEEAEEAMDVDVDVDDVPPPPPPELVASSSRAPRTPAPSKTKPARTPAPAPVTPAAPRSARPPRKSQLPEPSPERAPPQQAPVTPRASAPTPHRTPAQVLAEPAVPVQGADDAGYGKYYETLVLALKNNTVDRGLSKWTLDNLRECYPLLADAMPETMSAVWQQTSHAMREQTLEGATALLGEYKVPRRLQTFAQVIAEGREWAAEHDGEGRPDAWRPDLTPYVISAGTNLEVYDVSWKMLRDEYEEVSKSASERYRRVLEKQARLAELENGVADGVVELSQANALLKGFPTPEMLVWAEDVQTKLGARE